MRIEEDPNNHALNHIGKHVHVPDQADDSRYENSLLSMAAQSHLRIAITGHPEISHGEDAQITKDHLQPL